MRTRRAPGARFRPLRTVGLGALAVLCAMSARVPPADAQVLRDLEGGEGPLEIDAEEGIEWRRNEQLYVARGNARATRGEITIFADEMRAHYRSAPDGGTQIDRIDVTGDVRIVSPTETVYGERGAYDVENGILVLVGDNLRLEGAKDVITARDSLEYWEHKELAVARGEAQAVREDKRIQADVLTAHFEPDQQEELRLARIEAFGNVRVSTATEFARGERGTYFVEREFATLSGSVKITREENQLNGEYAEVDMKRGVSRLLPGPPGSATSARVHGLLVPERKPDRAGDS